jgi:pyruvate ferredoxin oxidoreductase gamma subunit
MVEEYELEGRKFRQPGKRSKDIPEIELSKSLEIRWHGRGGQGIWTASALFSQAVLLEGKSVRSSPEFGAEREGAPIKAYTRIGDEPIEDCSPVYNPDIIVIIDPTVVWEGIFEGLKRDGKVIVNYYKPQKFGRWKTFYVNATKIALEIFGKPYFNTPMLGATAKVTKAVELNSVIKVAEERFSGVYGDKNVTAIERGYEEVMEVE